MEFKNNLQIIIRENSIKFDDIKIFKNIIDLDRTTGNILKTRNWTYLCLNVWMLDPFNSIPVSCYFATCKLFYCKSGTCVVGMRMCLDDK
ncbi:hypothetical protein J2750_002305 [Methanococcoides alaskense]|uniref:Uncharacterized protein n=1 Tax=Methanococcoides alaskense TaxID=325778 RepID=A0AA90U1Y7_9EURY|nr:hypothetical protein [Methanococcoides alaskense]MDR6223828.1 hypothetical protein [Methanococcoides alaskense]